MQLICTHKGVVLERISASTPRAELSRAMVRVRELWHNPVITVGGGDLKIYSQFEYGRDNGKYLLGYVRKEA